jgi:phosphatidate cytidylyltransferase
VNDLAPRVAVAAVGIPAVLALLYFGGWILGVPLAFFAAAGAREVYRLAEKRGVRALSWLGMGAAAALVLLPVVNPDLEQLAEWALALTVALLATSLTAALWLRGPGGAALASASVTVFGALYTGLGLAYAILLHGLPQRFGWGPLDQSAWLGALVVALPLAATWIGDAAAYFAGSAWGRSKLFPAISPGKTWVGAWAGVGASAASSIAWLLLVRPWLPGLPVVGVAAAAGIGALLGVAAIIGDLAESLLKREAGVKDSGRFFPGHGGVLDRLDALEFTFPMAYLLLRVAEALA